MGQMGQGLPHGDLADPVFSGQFVFRGQAIVRLPFSLLDALQQQGLQLSIERQGRAFVYAPAGRALKEPAAAENLRIGHPITPVVPRPRQPRDGTRSMR